MRHPKIIGCHPHCRTLIPCASTRSRDRSWFVGNGNLGFRNIDIRNVWLWIWVINGLLFRSDFTVFMGTLKCTKSLIQSEITSIFSWNTFWRVKKRIFQFIYWTILWWIWIWVIHSLRCNNRCICNLRIGYFNVSSWNVSSMLCDFDKINTVLVYMSNIGWIDMLSHQLAKSSNRWLATVIIKLNTFFFWPVWLIISAKHLYNYI